MQTFLNTIFMLRVSASAALDRLAVWRILTGLAAAVYRPLVQLARRLLRAAPGLGKCEWLLEIDAFTRCRPFVPVLSMLYVIWRGAHTTLYGHIGTDSIIYPFLAAISGYNPFLGCVCGALFGVADLCQKLVASDISGSPSWFSLDYWGAMVGFAVGYSSLMMMGLLPGVLLRAFRRAIRAVLNSVLAGGAGLANPLAFAAGDLIAGIAAACLCSYAIMRYVAPVTNRASFYWRPHPEGACYNLEVEVLRRLRPAAMGGALIGSLIAALRSRRAVIFSTAALPPETFAECVRSMGGNVHPKRLSVGEVSDGAKRVWLFLQKREFTVLSPLLEEAVRLKLGTEPRTNILLEINQEPGSEQLAVRIANAFAGKVPVVVHNLRAPAGVYSMVDLRDMQDRASDLF